MGGALIWRTAIIFALIGPLVGTLIVFVASDFPAGFDSLDALGMRALYVLAALPLGYGIGAAPAAMAGLATGALQRKLPGRGLPGLLALLGVGTVCGLAAVGLCALGFWPTGSGARSLLAPLLLGGVSGAVCAGLAFAVAAGLRLAPSGHADRPREQGP